MKDYKYRSNVLRTEFRQSKERREKDAGYMRERRRKIKLGLIVPTPLHLKNKTKTGNYQRDYQREARKRVITHYGGMCECCGESHIEFLAVDHIDGGGRKHRVEIKSTNIALWIIRNNFPKGFRILCHNCNMAYGFWGNCPHKHLTK